MKQLLDVTLQPIYDFLALDPSLQPFNAVPPFLIVLQDILDTLGSLEQALPPGIWWHMVLRACNTRKVLENLEHSLQDCRNQAPVIPICNQGVRGAPRLQIDLDKLIQLAYDVYKDKDIAQLFGTTRRTIIRQRIEAGLPGVGYTDVDDQTLALVGCHHYLIAETF